MPGKVKFAEEASHEFRESVGWYESKTKGLGLEFTYEIDGTVEITNSKRQMTCGK